MRSGFHRRVATRTLPLLCVDKRIPVSPPSIFLSSMQDCMLPWQEHIGARSTMGRADNGNDWTRHLMAPSIYTSPLRDAEITALGELSGKFFAKELIPHRERWERQRYVDPRVWTKAGELGLLCCSIPEQYGGGGGTFAHDLAVIEAQAHAMDSAFGNAVHSGIVAHYILDYGTEEQRRRWLPSMATGRTIAAVAMTEPGAGSDLKNIKTTAIRDGDHYVINGAKTFISNGSQASLIVVVAKTDPSAGAKGVSLIVVETADCPGFSRGRILDKVGLHGQDTSELSFEDVRVPVNNLLGGREGKGFGQLMTQLAQERLLIGVSAVASMETAVAETITYTRSRNALGQRIFDFQNTKFVLAECQTTTHVGRVFIDSCIQRHLCNELDDVTAAMAKWWLTEQLCQVIDQCVQLFGGYGYMREYAVARGYADARVQKVVGGTNEIVKDIIARSL